MKRALCIPLLIIVLIAACGSPESQVETDIATPVSVQEVTLKPIEEYVTATGTVNPTQEAALKSEMAGFYHLAINPRMKKSFAFGDMVKKGDLIIKLENPEQENSIRIESQRLNLDISKSEHEKQQSLYEKGGVTLRELKDSERSYLDAQYSFDNANIQLEQMKVIAPFNGIVADIPYYTEGIKVDAGADMVHIMNYEKLTMEINLPGKLLGRISEGQPVRVTNYTVPDKKLSGIVTQVSPVLNPETRTFKATVVVENNELILRPGMFIKADVIVAQKDSTIVIPKDIIISRRNRKTVFVVERGTSIERSIETGLENPDEVEITGGLEVDERLVVEGFETLRNRSKVNIVR